MDRGGVADPGGSVAEMSFSEIDVAARALSAISKWTLA